MKTIGLLGGMSWQSTQSYYQLINQTVSTKLGGLNSAKICLYSVNFDEIALLQHQGQWQKCAELLSNAAEHIQAGGADILLICTNTMHKVADEISEHITIPLLHIADATAQQLIRNQVNKVALLGTKFTMSEQFYKGRLRDKFAIKTLVPTTNEQQLIHDIIYNELCHGLIKPSSKEQFLAIINNLQQQGAQAVILGCTEIALLITQADTDIPVYDTTAIHAQAAVAFALASDISIN